MADVDVLIAGAGPTGLTLAVCLERYGIRARVVDRLEGPSPLSRALAVQARTLEVFDDLGFAEAALARGMRVEGTNLVARNGRQAHLRLGGFAGLESHYPFILILPQDATEALLTEQLTARGGRVEWGVEVEGHKDAEGAVEVSLRHTDGRQETVRARWLVGCDGARSQVRKAAGIPFEGETYEDVCMLGDVRVNWSLKPGEIHLMPSRRGVMAAFPMPGGESRFRVVTIIPRDMAPPGEMPTPTLEQLQEVVSQLAPVPAQLSEPRWTSGYRLHRRGVSRYRQGRVLLAGDAAHIHSPAGGQGMNTGIQDAYNLAWKLAFVLQGRAAESLVDTYGAEREPVGRKLLEGTDRLFGFAAAKGPVARFARQYLVPLVAAPILSQAMLQRRLVRFVSQLYLHYLRSPLSTETVRGEDGPSAPIARGPAPGERVPELPIEGEGISRLHEALRGPSHVLLLFQGLDAPAPFEELLALARSLESTYAGWLRVFVVTPEPQKRGPGVLVDAQRQAHLRFGAGTPCAYLVRPDKYVGCRLRPVESSQLHDELRRRLTGATEAPAGTHESTPSRYPR
ncbi:FAD-dependent monooxygenase [Hyalangium minutum]|uniref:Monooxygenase, FAD-binding protein n=1 Tax=Hyalangium minutum TaxID=394096 RepID=A0A085WST3_9BACT|nr:FAD-dependent monooxygenase [Hyalangium minutum]KFE70746.1 monooxygenase, FAD-binding protein [Hyalangium minutum]